MSKKKKYTPPQLPPQPQTDENKGKKKIPWFTVIYNTLMLIITAAALAVSIYFSQGKEDTPKIVGIKERINQTSLLIKREFDNINPTSNYFNDKTDATNYKIFIVNVKRMILQWDSYEDIIIPEKPVKENIVVIKEKIINRKKFDSSLSDVINVVKELYKSDYIRTHNNIFPNKDAVNQTIAFQEIWITEDSINNNYSIASLEKLNIDLKDEDILTKKMLMDAVSNLEIADNDIDNRNTLLSFFRLVIELSNSFEQYKITRK